MLTARTTVSVWMEGAFANSDGKASRAMRPILPADSALKVTSVLNKARGTP